MFSFSVSRLNKRWREGRKEGRRGLPSLPFLRVPGYSLTYRFNQQNACCRNLCSPNGKCAIDKVDDSFYCICQEGFVGHYCEKGKAILYIDYFPVY